MDELRDKKEKRTRRKQKKNLTKNRFTRNRTKMKM